MIKVDSSERLKGDSLLKGIQIFFYIIVVKLKKWLLFFSD